MGKRRPQIRVRGHFFSLDAKNRLRVAINALKQSAFQGCHLCIFNVIDDLKLLNLLTLMVLTQVEYIKAPKNLNSPN